MFSGSAATTPTRKPIPNPITLIKGWLVCYDNTLSQIDVLRTTLGCWADNPKIRTCARGITSCASLCQAPRLLLYNNMPGNKELTTGIPGMINTTKHFVPHHDLDAWKAFVHTQKVFLADSWPLSILPKERVKIMGYAKIAKRTTNKSKTKNWSKFDLHIQSSWYRVTREWKGYNCSIVEDGRRRNRRQFLLFFVSILRSSYFVPTPFFLLFPPWS